MQGSRPAELIIDTQSHPASAIFALWQWCYNCNLLHWHSEQPGIWAELRDNRGGSFHGGLGASWAQAFSAQALGQTGWSMDNWGSKLKMHPTAFSNGQCSKNQRVTTHRSTTHLQRVACMQKKIASHTPTYAVIRRPAGVSCGSCLFVVVLSV